MARRPRVKYEGAIYHWKYQIRLGVLVAVVAGLVFCLGYEPFSENRSTVTSSFESKEAHPRNASESGDASAGSRNSNNAPPLGNATVLNKSPSPQHKGGDVIIMNPKARHTTLVPRADLDAAAIPNLAPRSPLAKESLQLPPGNELKVVVKFLDRFEARANELGQLVISSEGEEPELVKTVRDQSVAFSRLMTCEEEDLLALQHRAASRSGIAQPDLGGMLIAETGKASPSEVMALAKSLQSLPQVEFVTVISHDSPPPPPAYDIAPTTDNLVPFQTYRTSIGLNVDWAWANYGAKGQDVKLSDCEYAFDSLHEDLSGLISLQPGISKLIVDLYQGYDSYADHGTAVLGELTAADNNYGVAGISPGCSTWLYPEWAQNSSGQMQYRAAAITAAAAASKPGDVILMEMQMTGADGDYGPAEYDLAVWTAVKTGADAGVIVVSAAGNGAQNLDSAGYNSYRARGDSGAIIVGAGDKNQSRCSYSTYGSRVNIQAWGNWDVVTTGYGDYKKYGGDIHQEYTSTFAGTSSASPMVAGAAAIIQSAAKTRLGRPLTPSEMRSLLVDTGRPQTGDTSKKVGPLPDLKSALPTMLSRFKPVTYPAWGTYYFGNASVSTTADPDGDKLPNLLEYFLGTNPTVATGSKSGPLPVFSIVSTSGTPVYQFSFYKEPSRTDVSWVVETSQTLESDSWIPLVPDSGGVVQTISGNQVNITFPTNAPKLFLRLRVSK